MRAYGAEVEKLRRQVRALEDDTNKAVQMAMNRAEKEQQDAIKRAMHDVKTKLTSKHMIEIAAMKEDANRRVEHLRSESLKHAVQPHVQALAAEVARREAVEAELVLALEASKDAAQSRELAERTKAEAAEAAEARGQMERFALQQVRRAAEFVSSHEERVDMVRQYAEALESTVTAVEKEKAAIEERWRATSAAEVQNITLQSELDILTVRHAEMSQAEDVRAASRVAQVDTRRAELAAAVANAQAAAAAVTINELSVLLVPAKNDAILKTVAETRLEALRLDLEAAEAEHRERTQAAATAEEASLTEAETRVQTTGRQLMSARAEIEASRELTEAMASAAVLTSIVQDRADQVQESQARAQLLEAEGVAKYAPIAIAAPLECALADAAAHLEASTAEAAARAEHAEEVATASLEAAKEQGVVRENGMADQARTERDIAKANADATQKAVDAEIEARIKAEEQNAAARAEYASAMLRAEKMEQHAFSIDVEADKLIAAAKGWQKVAAETKTAAQRKQSDQERVDAEALRKTTSARLETALAASQRQLESALAEAGRSKQRSLERNDQMLQKKLEQGRAKVDLEIAAIVKQSQQAIVAAETKLQSTLNEVIIKHDAALAANRQAMEAATSDAAAKRDAAITAAHALRDTATSTADASAMKQWAAAVMAKTVDGRKTVAEFAEIQAQLAMTEEAIEVAKAKVETAKSSTASVSAQVDAEVTAARAMLSDALRASEARRLEAESRRKSSRQAVSAMRSNAKEQAAAVTDVLAATTTIKREGATATAKAASARNAESGAQKAVAEAEAHHSRLSAEAAAALRDKEAESDTARARLLDQLAASRDNAEQLHAIRDATAAADVARKESTARRKAFEAERRKAEEARMKTQHASIGRRPGGKTFFEWLRRSGLHDRDPILSR